MYVNFKLKRVYKWPQIPIIPSRLLLKFALMTNKLLFVSIYSPFVYYFTFGYGSKMTSSFDYNSIQNLDKNDHVQGIIFVNFN